MPAGMGFFEILGKVLLSMAIGYASNVITNALFGQKKAQDGRSPTYSFGPMATQTNSNMVMPMIYGKCQVAGNNLWQPDGENTTIYRLIGLGEGKIHSVGTVKLNDTAIGSLSGCSYSVYLGDGTQNIDSRVPGATNAARAEVVGGLKYDAYLAITATASDQLSGNFNMTCVVEGREVRVYSNLTTYTVQYSRNPSWCILDFLTAYNGCGLSYSDIDLQSFLDAAEYCDETVDGQPRFTLNLVIDERRSRMDWLAAMCLTCMAYPVYQDGKHGIKIEKLESPVAHFGIEPDEEFEIWESKPEEIFDRVKVIYVDPEYESTRVGAQAEVTTNVLRDQINTRDVEILGIDNFKQASRIAWFLANQANDCTTWAKYTTNRRAIKRTIGDIITTTDPVWGLINHQWRIMEMAESQNGRIVMGLREYNPALYTDAQGSVAPTVLVSNLRNSFARPESLDYLSATILGDQVLLTFRKNSGTPALSKGTKIRRGMDYASAQLVAVVAGKDVDTVTVPAMLGTTRYWATPYNDYGDATSPVSDDIVIDVLPQKEAVIDQLGYEATATISGAGQRIGDAIYQESTQTYGVLKALTYADLASMTVAQIRGAGAGAVVFTGVKIDLGKVASVQIMPDEVWDVAPDQPTLYEIKTSTDDVTYSDWRLLPVGQINTRYINLRGSINGQSRPGVLRSCNIHITAQLQILKFIDVTIPVGGFDFVFNPPFVNKPSFVVSPNGASGLTVKKTDESRSGGKVQLYSGATDNGGTADAIAIGF